MSFYFFKYDSSCQYLNVNLNSGEKLSKSFQNADEKHGKNDYTNEREIFNYTKECNIMYIIYYWGDRYACI